MKVEIIITNVGVDVGSGVMLRNFGVVVGCKSIHWRVASGARRTFLDVSLIVFRFLFFIVVVFFVIDVDVYVIGVVDVIGVVYVIGIVGVVVLVAVMTLTLMFAAVNRDVAS